MTFCVHICPTTSDFGRVCARRPSRGVHVEKVVRAQWAAPSARFRGLLYSAWSTAIDAFAPCGFRASSPRHLCDHRAMPHTTPLQLDDEGVLGLLRDFKALRTWEVLRSARTAATIAELAQATGLERCVLQEHVDLLAKHGLVDAVRARGAARRSRTSQVRRAVGLLHAASRMIGVRSEFRACRAGPRLS